MQSNQMPVSSKHIRGDGVKRSAGNRRIDEREQIDGSFSVDGSS
jgi:hypothetical protein